MGLRTHAVTTCVTPCALDCVATDILGASGRAMLDALVGGTTDPTVLADLARCLGVSFGSPVPVLGGPVANLAGLEEIVMVPDAPHLMPAHPAKSIFLDTLISGRVLSAACWLRRDRRIACLWQHIARAHSRARAS